MDQHLHAFKELCGSPWSSDDIIRKMITKHGFSTATDMALKGQAPDVDELSPIADESNEMDIGVSVEPEKENKAKEVESAPASNGSAVVAWGAMGCSPIGPGPVDTMSADCRDEEMIQSSRQSSEEEEPETRQRDWFLPKSSLQDIVALDVLDDAPVQVDSIKNGGYYTIAMVPIGDEGDDSTANREMEMSLIPETPKKRGQKKASSSVQSSSSQPVRSKIEVSSDLERSTSDSILEPTSFKLRSPAKPSHPQDERTPPHGLSSTQPRSPTMTADAVARQNKKRIEPFAGHDPDDDLHLSQRSSPLFASQPLASLSSINGPDDPRLKVFSDTDFANGNSYARSQAAPVTPKRKSRSPKNRDAPRLDLYCSSSSSELPSLSRATTLILNSTQAAQVANGAIHIDTSPVAQPFPNPNLVYPTETDKQYLKTLLHPTRLCDLPPHEFGRVRSLKTVIDTNAPMLEANVSHWLAMQHGYFAPVPKARKADEDIYREVLMIIDTEFAHTPTGAAVMDLLHQARIPATTAALPCKNTIIWKRRGFEFDVKSSIATKTSPEAPIFPLSEYSADLDAVGVILTPTQWAKANDHGNLGILQEVGRLYPGKRVHVLILYSGAQPQFGNMSYTEAGDLIIEMQLKYDIKFVTMEDEDKRDLIALQLGEWTKVLARRPYEFLNIDGPFFSFCPEVTDRTLARDARSGWVSFLTSSGISGLAASAIAFRYPTASALLSAYAAKKTVQERMTMLSPCSANGTVVGPQYSSMVYAAFHSPQADDLRLLPYVPLKKSVQAQVRL